MCGIVGASSARNIVPLLIDGIRRLDKGGVVLGIFDDVDYEEETLQVQPGDVLVVFSDGLSESVNPADEQYEDDRIVACVHQNAGAQPAVILERLLEDVREFCSGAAQPDDLTAMILKFNGPQAV